MRCSSPMRSKRKRSRMSSESLSAARPERYLQAVDSTAFGVVEKPLSAWERIANNVFARKAALLVLLALVWEGYARWLNNPLLFPTFSATIEAFHEAVASGVL